MNKCVAQPSKANDAQASEHQRLRTLAWNGRVVDSERETIAFK